MNEEAQAEAGRRNADGANCGGDYVLTGDPKDFDRQRGLLDAGQSGNFESLIEDAIGKHRRDTSAATRNFAPKDYWPFTGAFRTLFYHVGRRLGTEAVKLLRRIPDDDIRLFASIELAAALSGVPGPSIRQMKRAHRPDSPQPRGGKQ